MKGVYRWVPLKPDFLGAWKSVRLKHYLAYPIIIISLIIQRNLATKIQAKRESSLTAVRLKRDPPVFGAEVFLHYRWFFVKSNFDIGRVECKYNLYFTQGHFRKQFSLLPYTSACFYCSTISLLDESEEEGVVQLLTKEEEEIEVMQSWVELGGFPAWPEEEAKGLLAEASLSPCPPFSLPLSTLYRWVPLKPNFLGAWKSVQLKHYLAYPIVIISLIIQRNLATKIRAKWESGLTAVWLKQDPPVIGTESSSAILAFYS